MYSVKSPDEDPTICCEYCVDYSVNCAKFVNVTCGFFLDVILVVTCILHRLVLLNSRYFQELML